MLLAIPFGRRQGGGMSWGWGSVGILALCALRSTGSWLGSISPLYPLSLLWPHPHPPLPFLPTEHSPLPSQSFGCSPATASSNPVLFTRSHTLSPPYITFLNSSLCMAWISVQCEGHGSRSGPCGTDEPSSSGHLIAETNIHEGMWVCGVGFMREENKSDFVQVL